jgi:hypothetical protein
MSANRMSTWYSLAQRATVSFGEDRLSLVVEFDLTLHDIAKAIAVVAQDEEVGHPLTVRAATEMLGLFHRRFGHAAYHVDEHHDQAEAEQRLAWAEQEARRLFARRFPQRSST